MFKFWSLWILFSQLHFHNLYLSYASQPKANRSPKELRQSQTDHCTLETRMESLHVEQLWVTDSTDCRPIKAAVLHDSDSPLTREQPAGNRIVLPVLLRCKYLKTNAVYRETHKMSMLHCSSSIRDSIYSNRFWIRLRTTHETVSTFISL